MSLTFAPRYARQLRAKLGYWERTDILPQTRRARSSSPALRLILLCGLAALLRCWGPAFNVKGSWDGTLADIGELPRGLGPKSVGGLEFGRNLTNGFLRFAVDDGHLNMNYAEGPLQASIDDDRTWQAMFADNGVNFQAHGTDLDDVSWKASKQSTLKGLGDVEVNLNSEKDFGVSVVPKLPDVYGTQLKAVASSQNDRLHGRLEADRKLADNVHLTYSVKNTEGKYALADLKHSARLVGRLKDGLMDLEWGLKDQAQNYNATYEHDLTGVLHGNAKVVAGVDNDGVYGTFSKDHELRHGVMVNYEAEGRTDAAMNDSRYAHSASLSHPLGSLKLSHGTARPLEAHLESDVSRGATRLRGKLGYSSHEEAPRFNVTLSQDLVDVLDRLDADGEVQVGIDDTSVDGIYGRVAAKRKLGKGVTLDYSSGGRVNDIEHRLKLSNNLGYAQVVKSRESAPRLRLGYQFDV